MQKTSHVFKGTYCDITYNVKPYTQDILYVDILDKETGVTYKLHPNLESRNGEVAEDNTSYPLAFVQGRGDTAIGYAVILAKCLDGDATNVCEIEMASSSNKQRGDLEIATALVRSFIRKDMASQEKELPQAAIDLLETLEAVSGSNPTELIYKTANKDGKPMYIVTVKDGMSFDTGKMLLKDNNNPLEQMEDLMFDFSKEPEDKGVLSYINDASISVSPYRIQIFPIDDNGKPEDFVYQISPADGETDAKHKFTYPNIRFCKSNVNNLESMAISIDDMQKAIKSADKTLSHIKDGELPKAAIFLIEDLRAALDNDGHPRENKFVGITPDGISAFFNAKNKRSIPIISRKPSIDNREYSYK